MRMSTSTITGQAAEASVDPTLERGGARYSQVDCGGLRDKSSVIHEIYLQRRFSTAC
jgi:hypothetical protein